MWLAIGLTLFAVLIGIDIYLALDGIPGNTWSQYLRTWSMQTPLVPWVWSILLGHWFHPDSSKPLLGQPSSVVLLLWISVLLGLSGLVVRHYGYSIPSWCVIIAGFLAGAWLWPVK